jgi:hypothetical protein
MAGTSFEAALMPSTIPTGYEFKGWDTEPDGTGKRYGELDKVPMPSSNLTLYAIWDDSLSPFAAIDMMMSVIETTDPEDELANEPDPALKPEDPELDLEPEPPNEPPDEPEVELGAPEDTGLEPESPSEEEVKQEELEFETESSSKAQAKSEKLENEPESTNVNDESNYKSNETGSDLPNKSGEEPED